MCVVAELTGLVGLLNLLNSVFISFLSHFDMMIFFLFVVKFEYLVTLSCIFCFVSPLRGFISHKFALFSSSEDNILITSLEIKILLTSILSSLLLGTPNCFTGRKYQNRDYKYAILWVYYILLFSWFIIVPCYPLSILSLTVLYCSMIVWQKIFTLV